MDINAAFPSNYLKSADLQGRVAKLKISDVRSEMIGSDQKLVMFFQGKERGMVLNKTNARTIADVYGNDTDQWQGGEIEVFSMKVDFQGRMVDGLRVRVPPPPRQAAPRPAGSPNVMQNARPPQQAPQRQPEPELAMAGGDDPFEDEIPFAPEWR